MQLDAVESAAATEEAGDTQDVLAPAERVGHQTTACASVPVRRITRVRGCNLTPQPTPFWSFGGRRN